MRKLIAGAAAIALTATVAQADPGNGKGGGKAHAAAQPKGERHAQDDRGPPKKADRGPSKKADRGPSMMADRGPPMHADRGPGKKTDRGPEKKADRGHGNARRADRDHRPTGIERRADNRGRDKIKRGRDKVDRGNGRPVAARLDDDRRVRRVERVAFIDFHRNHGLIEGCPPGLAKKRNGCTPPGLLRDRRDELRYSEAYYRPGWWGYDSLDGRVFYDNGYLYRLGGGDSILGFIPLLGGALGIGEVWPSYYDPVPVPDYYVDYYNLGPVDSYRYADDVLYRVDPDTAAITSIAALLTGDRFAVGQPMPVGYDVYNVPYAYRDRYYDTPDAYYRYADGYIYQVDPTTRLIAAAIQLLV